MLRGSHTFFTWRSIISGTCLCTLLLVLSLFFVRNVSAHAILLRSDPAQDAILSSTPTQVHMWFSEDLNPAFSTAYVVNAANKANDVENDLKTHVDTGDVHIAASDKKELDLSLKTNLPPAVYVVLYRTQSADDGHILHGSYLFTIAAPNGTIPTFNGSTSAFDGGTTSTSGQFDGPTFFNILTITLVDLGAVFWVGAQFWRAFVLQLASPKTEGQKQIHQKIEQCFDRSFSLPILLLLFCANIGVLVGQALLLNNGPWLQALSPALLAKLVTQGNFGIFWIVREITILLAMLLTVVIKFQKKRTPLLEELTSWGNLILSLALLSAITLSGHATATRSGILVYAVISDLLHLIAASLWIGGMIYISLVYLPVLKRHSIQERAQSLLELLPRYSLLAFAGVLIMAITGPFNATTRMTSWDQLIDTMYGRTLLIKGILVGALMITSAIHVWLMRPRLAKNYKDYQAASETQHNDDGKTQTNIVAFTAQHAKTLELEIKQRTQRLSSVIRWEPLLGVAVLVCTSMLATFSGTLQTTIATPVPVTARVTPVVKPFTSTVITKDKLFQATLNVTPNRFGANVFTVTIRDTHNAIVPADKAGVSLYTTMLDMDMGTQSINLQPDGKGHFSASGDLNMGGNWQIRISIRTLDDKLHEATVDINAPF